jgi:hypothetical protein
VIEARGSGRLHDEAVVGSQLIEPYARRRRCEESPQPLEGGSDVVLGAAVGEIDAGPLGLRPQPCHRVMNAAIREHAVDRHPALRIEPVAVGERDQPRDRVGLGATGELGPAVEQKGPFVMVAGLAHAALDPRCRRPVGGKELAQRAGRGIDEFLEAKRGDAVRHPAPGRFRVDCDPSQSGLEEVHMRVRALRQAPGAILPEAAERMG